MISTQSVGERGARGRGGCTEADEGKEGSTKCYGRCSRRQPGYFPECVHEGNSTSLLGITIWNTVTENPPRQLLFSSILFLLLSFTPLLAPLCFISWKLIFHPHFVFPIFLSLSLSLSLSRRSHLTFPVLLSSNSLNIFGAVGTYFSITVPLITSVVLFLSTGMRTPSPPNIISLVWQLLSWKMAVTASATQRSAWEGERKIERAPSDRTRWITPTREPVTGWVRSWWTFFEPL